VSSPVEVSRTSWTTSWHAASVTKRTCRAPPVCTALLAMMASTLATAQLRISGAMVAYRLAVFAG
jgi:hypothetical protein